MTPEADIAISEAATRPLRKTQDKNLQLIALVRLLARRAAHEAYALRSAAADAPADLARKESREAPQ